MKVIKAVKPYIYKGQINFKHKPFCAWKGLGLPTVKAHHPWRWLHRLVFNVDFPSCEWIRNRLHKNVARLRFVQPETILFDAFPDYALYEIVPFAWDVWPNVFEKFCDWLKKHRVKTLIVTCEETKLRLQAHFPNMNILSVLEGIDVDTYKPGKELKDRQIDYLEYGRNTDRVVKYKFPASLNVLRGQTNGCNMLPYDVLLDAMQNSKVVVAYPKTWTNPELADGLETMTQRYWECMLSRMVMIGHAPKELVDFIGYNPVIEVDLKEPDEQLQTILSNISEYQALVNRNRETALRMGSWDLRMQEVMEFLKNCGYEC